MKYVVTYLINKEAGKEDGRLRCRVRIGAEIVSFCVGYRVMIAGWNTDTQRCKRGSMHGKNTAQKINAAIDRTDALIASILNDVDSISIAEFKRLIKGKGANEKSTPLSDVLGRFSDEEKIHWSDGTLKKFNTLKRHFGEYKNGGIFIEEMTVAWMKDYTRHLCKTMGNSSVNKEMKNVRWFLRWAIAQGYRFDTEAAEYNPRLKTAQKKVIFLEWDELMRMYGHDFNNLHLAEVRDVFCFCCFTGLRFSDVYALKKSDVHDGHISVTTIKTGELIDIPLSKYARAIVDRYRDDDLKGRALPVCNNAEMNGALKDVAKACGMDDEITVTDYRNGRRTDVTKKKYELITTHCGRRTFVCNALMLGIPAEVVMTITGHRDYKSMKPYIAVADKTKRDAIGKFDSL